MTALSRRFTKSLRACLCAVPVLAPAAALAEGGPAPRYTYLGAGYEAGDSRCGIEPGGTGLSGFTAEGSLGLFRFLHLVGNFYDGETDGRPEEGILDDSDRGGPSVDGQCYELGLGVNWNFAPGADLVLRGYWVNVETDDPWGVVEVDADGFEPELLVRYAISDKVEINAGLAYYDIEDSDLDVDVNNTEVRVGLVYNVLPWLAVRAGGSVFDTDTSFNAGVRAYFGGNLF